MATSCSHHARLLCCIALAENCWASMHRAHTLSCVLSRFKWFATPWVHWVACIHAKACNSHELSVSGAPAGNMKALSLIRSSTLLRVMANFTLLPLNVKRVLVLLHYQLHSFYPYYPSTAPTYKCAHLWKQNPFSLSSYSSHATTVSRRKSNS